MLGIKNKNYLNLQCSDEFLQLNCLSRGRGGGRDFFLNWIWVWLVCIKISIEVTENVWNTNLNGATAEFSRNWLKFWHSHSFVPQYCKTIAEANKSFDTKRLLKIRFSSCRRTRTWHHFKQVHLTFSVLKYHKTNTSTRRTVTWNTI